MRIYAICRNCAEVRLAHLDCPRCDGAAPEAPALPRLVLSARADATSDSPSDPAVERARMTRISTIVVGAYVFAVLGLLAAAFARV